MYAVRILRAYKSNNSKCNWRHKGMGVECYFLKKQTLKEKCYWNPIKNWWSYAYAWRQLSSGSTNSHLNMHIRCKHFNAAIYTSSLERIKSAKKTSTLLSYHTVLWARLKITGVWGGIWRHSTGIVWLYRWIFFRLPGNVGNLEICNDIIYILLHTIR